MGLPNPRTPPKQKNDMGQIEDLLRMTTEKVNARRRFPEATYRLQFHAKFTFQDATRILPYLRDRVPGHGWAPLEI